MRIMIATDGSPRSQFAVDLVAGLPLPAGSTISLVSVVDLPPVVDPFGGFAAVGQIGYAGMETQVADAVRADLDALVPRLQRSGVTVEARVLVGRAALELSAAARAWPADLLVVGSRGRGPIKTMLLGSVSAELVREAPCPLLVVRRTKLERVILATDGSPAARAAEAFMASPILAGCTIEVASVDEAVYHPSGAAGVDRDAEYAAAVADARSRSTSLASETAGRLQAAGLRTSTWSAMGDPADQLIERAAATGADVVALGTRGLSGVDGLLLGSVARNVLTQARCSVLVVPAG